MDCLVLPVSALVRSRRWGSRVGYNPIVSEGGFGDPDDGLVTVVVGKERKEFLVDGTVLEEYPFRDLIDLLEKDGLAKHERRRRKRGVMCVDVDSILFEHMLWLMYNDTRSLSELNLREVIDFYAQE
ncbi:hypothetical protein MLD38_010639 [Melastoma candidum]|uniref:Uncharacterized protein n=1 Tax=Melastoma candidum TaxID=119954 RepID=A0ACB9R2A7_9MYRT|nr:hypothetical protein MLD38_010639 [Melastoma candidum]